MVFDWDGPVSYSADVVNGDLVVHFNRPVPGEVRSVLKPLSRYLRSVSISADRMTATFPLARPVTIKAFTNGTGSTVIDLMESSDGTSSKAPQPVAAAPVPVQAAPVEAPPPAVPTPAPASEGPVSLVPTPAAPPTTAPSAPAAAPPAASKATAAAPSPNAPLPTLEVRAGEHGSYNRLVFDWPKAVDYKVDKQDGRATVTFGRPIRVDMVGLQSSLPQDISMVSAETGPKTTTVVLSVPPQSRLRHFASGNKVVVDVVRAPDAPAPANAPSPLAQTAKNEPPAPTVQPTTTEPPPSLPAESLTAPAKPEAAAKPPAEPAKPPAGLPPASLTAAAPPAAEKGPVPPPPAAAPVAPVTRGEEARPPENDKIFSLSVPWEKPVAAAVFERAGYTWVVFDRKEDVDTRLLKRLGGEAVTFVQQMPHKDGTVLRLIIQPEYVPSMRRDGLMWVIDLSHRSALPPQVIQITAPAALSSGVGIALAVNDAGTPLQVADPEVGDTMTVVPVIPAGSGVFPGRDTPDVEILQTYQGVALAPHVDGIDVKSSRSGVTIGLPNKGGMRLSPSANLAAQAQAAPTTAAAATTGFIDVPTWLRSGPEHYDEERKILEDGLQDLPPARRAPAHMAAARFYFANGFAPEALGYLRMAAVDEPTIEDTGPYRALRGAANALLSRWDLALPDLDSPLVQGDPETRFWAAIAHAASSENPGEMDKAISAGMGFLKPYPKRLKWQLAGIAAESALAAADDSTAQDAITLMGKLAATPMEQGQLAYLQGAYGELQGKFDKALYYYDLAEKGGNREYRARAALASIELRLKTKKLKPLEAVEKLDHLRFAWREGDFEFNLLRRLSELQAQAGDYPNALRSLRSLANNYPENKGTPAITALMSDLFTKLYLDGVADKMSAVSAIGLYDEFRDLTPSGPQGDEMIRRLADRLASVDLLERAADLLKHQVDYRLQGLDKARVGAQLAVLDLLDHKPQAAVDALAASSMDGLPPDLQLQRRHLMARALADVGRVQEGVLLLANDTSPEAGLLRAEIYWRAQDWANAATAFESLVERPSRGQPIDDASAKMVLSWATALTLANDERGLATLRRNFGPAMTQTPYNDGFNLLTSALDKELPDMNAIKGKIKEAEGFQKFMTNYRNQLQKGGLSGIN